MYKMWSEIIDDLTEFESSLNCTIYIYIYICVCVCGEFIKFPDIVVQALKIVVDSWKFSMLLLYNLWDDWPFNMISGLNEQLQKEFEYILLKPGCHSRWILKMQTGRESI